MITEITQYILRRRAGRQQLRATHFIAQLCNFTLARCTITFYRYGINSENVLRKVVKVILDLSIGFRTSIWLSSQRFQ